MILTALPYKHIAGHTLVLYTVSMKYKTLIMSLGALAIAALGYYFFVMRTPSTPHEEPTPVSGKLDINAVCDGALAYMTFADAAQADAFVAECKEGKHPEVIEHYKAQMNLGDGATI